MEQDNKSLAQELGEHIEAAEASPELDTSHADTSLPSGDQQAPPSVDASTIDAQPEKGEQAAPIQDQDGQAAQDQTGPAVTPPATWSASAKAIYAQLPEVARKEIAKREQDYARGIQQYAEAAKRDGVISEIARPYDAMLRSEGANPATALKSYLQQAYVMRTGTPEQKASLLLNVAQQYGIDLTKHIGQPSPDDQQDPMKQVHETVQQLVSPALQKIQQWEQSQASARQHQEQAMVQEVQGQIEAFQNATNEDGTPKHLYFDNVRGLMSGYLANGEAKTLEQAYEMACWAHPEVRPALIAEQQRAGEAKRLEEAKRKANEARNASFDVKGQGAVGISGQNKTSLRDELSSQLDAAFGGARV